MAPPAAVRRTVQDRRNGTHEARTMNLSQRLQRLEDRARPFRRPIVCFGYIGEDTGPIDDGRMRSDPVPPVPAWLARYEERHGHPYPYWPPR